MYLVFVLYEAYHDARSVEHKVSTAVSLDTLLNAILKINAADFPADMNILQYA
jgi:hypothetical protein